MTTAAITHQPRYPRSPPMPMTPPDPAPAAHPDTFHPGRGRTCTHTRPCRSASRGSRRPARVSPSPGYEWRRGAGGGTREVRGRLLPVDDQSGDLLPAAGPGDRRLVGVDREPLVLDDPPDRAQQRADTRRPLMLVRQTEGEVIGISGISPAQLLRQPAESAIEAEAQRVGQTQGSSERPGAGSAGRVRRSTSSHPARRSREETRCRSGPAAWRPPPGIRPFGRSP